VTPRDIDLATIRTWPAAITEQRDGWHYCAASGVTGRVNAVWPIDWSGADIDAAITDVEAWYAAHNLPPRFKLTDGAYAPSDLTDHLTRRGYEAVNPTLIMTASLSSEPGHHEGVTLSPTLPALFDQALRDSTPDPDDLEERRSIARRLPQPCVFALRERDVRAVATGASAIADKLAGVFLMRTVPEARRQGHALHILRALMQWASENGATHAFLQVDADNAPAIALYEHEGFATLSTYRFWRKP
jgi:N-acetylglutamate synthase